MSFQLPTRLEGGPLAVATHDLHKSYGGQAALDGVELQVPEGSVYVLVGPNGAGKTTLLKTLLDLVRADRGRAEVLGLDPRADGPRVRGRIGYVPERHDWGFGWMRVGRLLRHHAVYHPSWDEAYAARLARAFELRLDQRYGRLSKGQARRVQLLMALAHRPSLLLLDEPTDGLDPVMRDETLGLLADHLAATPTTVLVSTHLVHEIETMADHFGALRGGRLHAQLPVEALHRGLRRYRAEVPEGWQGVATLNGAVVRRAGSGREIQWTVWGEESEIVGHLSRAGATVRAAAPLTLADAAIALLSRRENVHA
jgi:ABC-2 type transport system ATP-binding protein